MLDKARRKDAVKKVIAAMTVGKDVSPIFPDVVNCMQTDDLELKKLVYLYLINYAKSQPDLAIMAVNTFVKVGAEAQSAARDCQSSSHPLLLLPTPLSSRPSAGVLGEMCRTPRIPTH